MTIIVMLSILVFVLQREDYEKTISDVVTISPTVL